MKKIKIKNRKGQTIVVILDGTRNPNGLVFIMHGLGGNKDQMLSETFAESFREKGYTVLRFDTTNTLGESDGRYEDATLTNYYEDLQDVIAWAKKHTWYREPFYLVGHSLGGISTSMYAARHPSKV